jgi:hypothetical protein
MTTIGSRSRSRRLVDEARNDSVDDGVDLLVQVQNDAALTAEQQPTVCGVARRRFSLHTGVVIRTTTARPIERLCRYGIGRA